MTRYKTVALNKLTGKPNQKAQDVLAPVAKAIEAEAVGGWEYVNMYDMPIFVQPGCLASLLGAKGFYDYFYMIVFKKED